MFQYRFYIETTYVQEPFREKKNDFFPVVSFKSYVANEDTYQKFVSLQLRYKLHVVNVVM